MTWRRLLGKIVIVTGMHKVPESCSKCRYYDSMGNRPGRGNDGICTARPSFFSTSSICITKERLPNCPLRLVEKDGPHA